MDERVQQLYLRLTEALQRTRRDAFGEPVTVAEIYQELVPYRQVRGEVGFDMNADYEHALLRLLAGEGGHAHLEPTHARDAIARELSSSNPNVSLYREYAACDVWVTAPGPVHFEDALAAVRDVLDDEENMEWTPLPLLDEDEAEAATFSLVETEPTSDPAPAATRASAATPATSPSQPLSAAEAPSRSPAEAAAASGGARPAGGDTSAAAEAKRPSGASAPAAAAASAQGSKASAPAPDAAPSSAPSTTTPAERAPSPAQPGTVHCAYCDSPLPAHRPARFCPYCGHDQTTRPCPTCGEPLEPGWVFCVSCGTSGDGR